MKFCATRFSMRISAILMFMASFSYAFTQDHQQHTPAKTIIAFDIHGVLVTYDKAGLIWPIVKNLGALRFLLYKGVREHLKEVLQKKTPTPESYFLELAKVAPGIKPYFPGFFDISNTYKPILGMQELLDDLKNAGYELHIFSNIGDLCYHGWEEDGIQAKGLKTRLTKLFEHFPDNNVVTNALKPEVTQYNELEEKHPGKTIVFIDDRQNNIDATQKTANNQFKGIRFQSPEQVRDELEKLGILTKKPQDIPSNEFATCSLEK